MAGKVTDFINEQLIVVTGKSGTDIWQQPRAVSRCEPPVIQPSGGILIMPDIRARYSGRGWLKLRPRDDSCSCRKGRKQKPCRNSNRSSHGSRTVCSQTSDNLRPQMCFVFTVKVRISVRRSLLTDVSAAWFYPSRQPQISLSYPCQCLLGYNQERSAFRRATVTAGMLLLPYWPACNPEP
ncbi:hypothetical protein BANRA_05068 [Escherichia coli]|nr:hypothetical protein BANRA_05068 [Escherichia coli]